MGWREEFIDLTMNLMFLFQQFNTHFSSTFQHACYCALMLSMQKLIKYDSPKLSIFVIFGIPGELLGDKLCFCLENPMDRGA